MEPAAKAAHAGSFEHDTLTWAFARLAERTLDHLFSQPSARARYGRLSVTDVPCAGLAIATRDELGNTYFSSSDHMPTQALQAELAALAL